MNNSVFKNSQLIKEQSLALSFLSCGISKAGFLENEAPRLEQWLKSKQHGKSFR
tara:strand:+ start:43 stop:204 length:162 start_codon:yes stop_codon:yes gene_type:complete